MDFSSEHIDQFDRFLKDKGFDEAFSVNTRFPFRLERALKSYLGSWTEGFEKGPLTPFDLTMYFNSKEVDGHHLAGIFRVDYNEDQGFSISEMKLQLMNSSYSQIATQAIPVGKTQEMPDRTEAIKKAKELMADLNKVQGRRFKW